MPRIKEDKEKTARETEVANAQMKGAIKKQGTSKTSQTAADQQPLADEAEQSRNSRS